MRVRLLSEPLREERLNRQARQARQEINNHKDRNCDGRLETAGRLF
jgi:hypothetical protein